MATIKDVARIAGVSVSTVSHVVNGTRYVSPEKVRKVEDAIRQLDELPNFIAKRSALKSKLSESRYVLILLSKKRSLFQNQVKEKLEEIVEQKGYIAISLAYDLDEDRLAAIRALAGTLDLAGMVAFPDREGVLSGAFFKGLRFPVVLIGNPVDRFAADTLLPDTFEGSYRAVRHLIKNGHERIAYLCESEVCGTQRFEGYRKALESAGLDPYIGFMHRPRPGRRSLALDLMEELRAVYADRFVLSCVNRKIITAKHLQKQESGAVLLTDDGRRAFLGAWQSKKQEQITHPFLKEKIPWGLVPYVQALLLARTLRGDLEAYPPFFWK